MTMNEALHKLYLDANSKVYKTITEKNKKLECNQAAYPFFLKLPDIFINSKNKIMIYGQETYGWSDVNNDASNVYCMGENNIDGILECYNRYFNNKDYKNNHSPFWNVFRLLNDYFNECGKEFGYLWNNITKLGLNGNGFPYNWYDDIIKPYFNDLIVKELEIIKPDFLVFFTGTTRDFIIDDIFNKPERKDVAGFSQDDICEIKIPNIKKALRTHHPNTLYMNSNNGSYKKIIGTIHDEIYKDMNCRQGEQYPERRV
jgi:hypothetical protein